MTEAHGFSRGELFMQNISSFWSRVFRDADIATAMADGTEEVLAQNYFNLLELVLALSVEDIPVFHREKWVLLTFRESDKNRNAESLLRYGQGAVYGTQPSGGLIPGQVFSYGGFAPRTAASFKLPDPMVDIESYLTNRIYEPSLVQIKGQDFFIRNGVIFFKEDPFENDLVPRRDIRDESGAVVDREIALWALNSDHDYQFLWKNYGYLIDVFLESSDNYKQFLRAAWELFWVGPRITSLLSTLNALLGLPTIIEPVETVQTILIEDGTRKIITDRNFYELDEDTPVRQDLETGLELLAGDPLANVIRIFDGVSNPEWWNNYPFLPIPVSILTEEHFSDLVVFNEIRKSDVFIGATIPLQVSGNMTESRRAEFESFPLPIGGGWNVGDTKFSYLSLDLLFQFFFKAHLFLLEINVDKIQASRLTRKVVELLNEALPAYVYFIALNEIELAEEYNLDEDADDPDWEFEKAHAYVDEYSAIDDGYQSKGPWIIGFDTIIITDPPQVVVGGTGFQPGMRWYLRRKPC